MLRQRYLRILWFFGTVTLNIIFWDLILPAVGLRRLSRRTRAQRLNRIAVNFRRLAVRLGGVMIKVGQFLSARLDVLPRVITDELAGLQDEVPPERFEDIRPVIEAEFGVPLEERFCWFDPTPMASASIGQVHRARLAGQCQGEDGAPASLGTPEVVVKVQRPLIPRIVQTDMAALRVVAGWLKHYKPISKRANVSALIDEFGRTLDEECDYLHEGKAAEVFAANFAERPEVLVPKVYWSHTTKRVLTLERVDAIKITDYAAIEAAGISRAEVAERLLDTYLKQVFEDHFFHADPHPGNLFVLPLEEGRWKLVFVDFGMSGEVPERVFTALRSALIAVVSQDAPRVVQAYADLGMLLPGADQEQLARATARVFETFWGKSTAEMMNMHQTEMVNFVNDFGDLIYEMPFQVPENIMLMARALGILSGMCSGLDPDFNIWTSVLPYATRLMEAEQDGRGVEYWIGEIDNFLKPLLSLPRRADAVLARMEQGRLEVRTPELSEQLRHLEHSQRRTAAAVVFAGLLLAGTQFYLAGQMLPAALLGAAALVALGVTALGRR